MKENDIQELLPCPFCEIRHLENKEVFYSYDPSFLGTHRAGCKLCEVIFSNPYGKESVVKSWNSFVNNWNDISIQLAQEECHKEECIKEGHKWRFFCDFEAFYWSRYWRSYWKCCRCFKITYSHPCSPSEIELFFPLSLHVKKIDDNCNNCGAIYDEQKD